MSDHIMTDERQILFENWDSIPAAKLIDVSKNVYKSNPIRISILKNLSEGLSDDSTDDGLKIRHVLNVTEIKKLLQEKNDIKISQTNLYFHLNKLEEVGMIKEVATLLEGPHKRNRTKYYGRVARHLFITDQQQSYERIGKQFGEFKRLADLLEIELPENFLELPKKYVELSQKHYSTLAHWLSSHESIIEREKINDSEIFEFL
ncbi:MAG: winged helix-turn-helix domain-containing protein, partial [Candidatus Kariarchaeaceae archaeon]